MPNAKVLFLPDSPGIKDITDYIAKGGDLNELLKTSKRFQDIGDVIADRAERLATWHSTFFHDAYLHIKEMEARPKKTYRGPRVEGNEVERAKQYPISDLIKFNASGSAKCIFHAEKESSLHYYSDDNHCYCFGGCGRAYDAIDVYRKLNGSTFREAVRALQ
jgi:hypothetical protein